MTHRTALALLTLCLTLTGLAGLTGCNSDTHASFHSGENPRLRHDLKRTAHDIDHDVNAGTSDPHFAGEW
jgi:hypothetical protein